MFRALVHSLSLSPAIRKDRGRRFLDPFSGWFDSPASPLPFVQLFRPFLLLFRSWGTRIGKYVWIPSSRPRMLEISLRRRVFADINNLLFSLRPEALVKSSSRSFIRRLNLKRMMTFCYRSSSLDWSFRSSYPAGHLNLALEARMQLILAF